MSERLQPCESPPWAPEPVCTPEFWRVRLEQADGEIHRSLFSGSLRQFSVIEAWQRDRVREGIGNGDSILDAGCGYGRLLDLLPLSWWGDYLGVDVSPEFVALARQVHPRREFLVADLRDLRFLPASSFDVAVCVWIEDMVRLNAGEGVWQAMELELRRVARRVLIVGVPEEKV